MSERIPSKTAKRRLATMWFTGAGVLFSVLMLQSTLGHYGTGTGEVWNWFLPNVVPTLTLVVGVLVSDALGRSEDTGDVDRFIYRLAFLLSIGFMLALSLPVFIAPFSELPPPQLLKSSQLWLVPLQGIVSAALGAFFVNKK